MHCSQWKRKPNNGKSEHATWRNYFDAKNAVSSGLSFLPREKGWVARGQRTWAYSGAGTWSQGPLFRCDCQQLVLVMVNPRPTSVTAGPVGPRVLVQKWSFYASNTSPREPGRAVRQCVMLEAWTPWGGDRGIQVSSLGLGGKVSLDTIWKGFCKWSSAWKRKLKSQVKMRGVVMYECESWTIKKAECQRIDAFKLWCWRRLLRVPWRARRSNQSIQQEINPEYSLEGLDAEAEAPVLWLHDLKT